MEHESQTLTPSQIHHILDKLLSKSTYNLDCKLNIASIEHIYEQHDLNEDNFVILSYDEFVLLPDFTQFEDDHIINSALLISEYDKYIARQCTPSDNSIYIYLPFDIIKQSLYSNIVKEFNADEFEYIVTEDKTITLNDIINTDNVFEYIMDCVDDIINTYEEDERMGPIDYYLVWHIIHKIMTFTNNGRTIAYSPNDIKGYFSACKGQSFDLLAVNNKFKHINKPSEILLTPQELYLPKIVL